MSENNDLLVFKWKVKDCQLEEIFDPKEQNLLRNDYDVNNYEFEYSDYIFEMHSVVNTYIYDKLSKRKEFAEECKKIPSEIIKFDTHVLKAVQYLKLLSSAIYELEIKLQEFRSQEIISNPDEIAGKVWMIFLNLYNSIPKVGYKNFIRLYFGKINGKFRKSGKWNIIDHGLSVIRNGIQKKANIITDQASSIFRLDLWDAFDVCKKNGYNQTHSIELKKQISQLSYDSDYAIDMLQTLVSGYIKKKRNGCVAICVMNDEKKYYSLSGTMEYTGSCAKIKKNRQKFDSTIAKLSPGKNFIRADLTDKVKYYGHRVNVDENNPYFSEPKKVIDADSDPDFQSGDVSCCERKIMAAEPNAQKYEFYIRIDPCDFCRPALLPKDKDITFMTSEGDCPFVKLKVVQERESGDLSWYGFVDA